MKAYYNEIDPYAAQWLRNLIDAGHIAAGDVDTRSIEDVTPEDIKGYTQCHFFAGIGVWSYALRRAGWPDNRPAWTGSCPCQPFSTAGKGGGFADERHLWPAWFHLIQQCQPVTIFGEQVASKDGLGWFDLVQADLEGANYTSAAFDLCAAGIGAPHIRQRLWFVAHPTGIKLPSWSDKKSYWPREKINVERCNTFNVMANTNETRLRTSPQKRIQTNSYTKTNPVKPCRGVNFWSDADWIRCIDGKYRPIEPGTFPLANGIANRVGRLRAYGNAINAEIARVFIESFLDFNLTGETK